MKEKTFYPYVTGKVFYTYIVLHLIRKGVMGQVASKTRFKEFRQTNIGWKIFQEERKRQRFKYNKKPVLPESKIQ